MNKNMTWEEENDKIIEEMVKKRFRGLKSGQTDSIELFITSTCNQNCEYCYLVKYEDQLYPKEFRDPQLILKNLKMLFDYMIENDIAPSHMDIFSGEIWQTKFGLDILDSILNDYIMRHPSKPLKEVVIPANMFFIVDREQTMKIQQRINAYRQAGSDLIFSCSNDGALIDRDIRVCNTEEQTMLKDTDTFYKDLFTFCVKNHYGFHPMVAASSIEKWPEQYDWWAENLLKYFSNTVEDKRELLRFIMFLEVRNDDWTDEKILSFLKFLNHKIDKSIDFFFDGDIYSALCHYFRIPNQSINFEGNYSPLCLVPNGLDMQCSIERNFIIRLGDLSWVPCHRTSYEKFILGTFKVQDDKIIGMQAKNIPLMFAINGINCKGHIKCDTCPNAPVCMRGCYGSQFENTGEIFYPVQSVCNLAFAKTLFLYHKYKNIVSKNTDAKFDIFEQNLNDLYQSCIQNFPKEIKDKWETKIIEII